MEVNQKYISYRIYLVAVVFLLLAVGIVLKLTNIQWVQGAHYRKLAKERTVKNFVIPANKGNIYSSDGSLLATSIPNFTIRFDALAPKNELFNQNVQSLSDSLAIVFKEPSYVFLDKLRKARANKSRYLLLKRGLSYSQLTRIKTFPIFNKGAYKGGLIVEQNTVREHPIGKIAERTIGYQRTNPNGIQEGKGIEWAYRDFLNGKDGKIIKQKIAKGQWKPIGDNNQVEPQDGYDIIATLDVYIQDIAHHALLTQLQTYDAEHGCVVVMETHTGAVKAISNLGRASDGTYYETTNYAITESHEPGSTFKLVDLIALLEDKKADTTKVYDTKGGVVTYFGKKVRDSHEGGYGKISLARGFELSSNTVMVQAVYEAYKDNPKKFVQHINDLALNRTLNMDFKGEGLPVIPQPSDKSWSRISLPWMAFGYGVSVTPMQTLTLYNAIANDGVMVKPHFVSEIKEWSKTIKKIEPEVINPQICSKETRDKIKALLKNVVKKGTASQLYSKNFSMAGKTGTAQVNYNKSGTDQYYASSFVGYFPSDKPKYSCIVVVHKPSTTNNNYYGADVAGPVFKRIAQKIFTDSPATNFINGTENKVAKQEADYEKYFDKINANTKQMPKLIGMPIMDAIALLENIGVKVNAQGTGRVIAQSVPAGERIVNNRYINLETR
jgi:cell division protein FtsI (penicillin-binding protein 3)